MNYTDKLVLTTPSERNLKEAVHTEIQKSVDASFITRLLSCQSYFCVANVVYTCWNVRSKESLARKQIHNFPQQKTGIEHS